MGNVAGETLKINMSTLGPQVLPYSEQLKFLWNIIQRKVLKKKMKAYIPDFRKAFEHFCIHAGGRGVIDALEENLKLTTEDVLPSRHALKYYGNTSSASIWYELAWSETFPTVQRGDVVWQIGFGSGFKCNSAVWKAMKNNKKVHRAWTTESEKPLLSRSYKGGEIEMMVDGPQELADAHMGFDGLSSFKSSFNKSRPRRGRRTGGVPQAPQAQNKPLLKKD